MAQGGARRIRISDVARLAEVSVGTVSNVYNRPKLVRPEVRERVLQAAEMLGYRGPDPRARSLRAGQTDAIGVVIADTLSYFFEDPFAVRFLAGIAEVCDARGAALTLISSAGRADAAANIARALVDGFIVHCLADGTPLVEAVRARRLPFVAVDLAGGEGGSSVRIDDRGGARAAAAHVAGLGHRKIAILSCEIAPDTCVRRVDRARIEACRYPIVRDRLAGYADALAEAGMALDAVTIVECENTRASAARGMEIALEHAPDLTAVIAMSDIVAMGALATLRARGLAVPRDVSVVGFDDVDEAERTEPPLTTVRQPIVEKGRWAAQFLFDDGIRSLVLPTELVVRASTAPPRALTVGHGSGGAVKKPGRGRGSRRKTAARPRAAPRG